VLTPKRQGPSPAGQPACCSHGACSGVHLPPQSTCRAALGPEGFAVQTMRAVDQGKAGHSPARGSRCCFVACPAHGSLGEMDHGCSPQTKPWLFGISIPLHITMDQPRRGSPECSPSPSHTECGNPAPGRHPGHPPLARQGKTEEKISSRNNPESQDNNGDIQPQKSLCNAWCFCITRMGSHMLPYLPPAAGPAGSPGRTLLLFQYHQWGQEPPSLQDPS